MKSCGTQKIGGDPRDSGLIIIFREVLNDCNLEDLGNHRGFSLSAIEEILMFTCHYT